MSFVSSRRYLFTVLAPTALFAATLALSAPAHAQTVYLVGAYLYSGDSAGATVSTTYQYDTNSNDGAAYLMINGAGGGAKSISLAITPASLNNFTIQSQSTTSLVGPNPTLGLFFSTSPTSYNPTPSGTARTPDLLVSVPAGGTAFFTPTAGTAINNYAYSGSSTANGLSTFTVGNVPLTITSFTAANGAGSSVAGSFSIRAGGTAAAPEPGTLALLLAASAPVIGIVARRKRG